MIHSNEQSDPLNNLFSFDWLLLLWKKKLISSLLFISLAVLFTQNGISKPKTYESKSTFHIKSDESDNSTPSISIPGFISGKQNGNDPYTSLKAISQSQAFKLQVIDSLKLLPLLFGGQESFESARNFYKNRDQALRSHAADIFTDYFTLALDKNENVILTTTDTNALSAQKLNTSLLYFLNKTVSNKKHEGLNTDINFISKQIESTDNANLKQQLITILKEKLTKQILINISIIDIIDPPTLAYQHLKPQKKIVLVISTLSSFFLTLFIFWIFSFVCKLRILIRSQSK